MKNTIVSHANLSLETKMAFKEWLSMKTRDLISFPFQGKHMKGYIFNQGEDNYLVVMQLNAENIFNASLEGIEQLDINEEF